MKQLLTIGLALLLCLSLNAAQKMTRDADYAFEMKQYATALQKYKSALPKETNKAETARIHYQMGECYRMNSEWANAFKEYQKARKGNFSNDLVVLRMADALRFQGKYAEALVLYEEYQKLVPSSPEGALGIQSCTLAQRWLQDSTRWQVVNEEQLNTRENDFSPTYSDKKHQTLIITSKRAGQTGTHIDPVSGVLYSDLFEARIDKNGRWSTPQNVAGTVNSSDANEGASCVSKKGDHLYFTRCDQQKNKEVTCKIYMATKKGNSWDNAVLIDFGLDPLMMDSFNFRHPAISADESVLVFSSDMRGTTGGSKSDLWVSYYDKKTKSWGRPQNLGPKINTAGREGFPVIRDDGTLYFASDGHLGMGGLDLFSATKTSATEWKWGACENMKAPFNSPADDFGLVFDGLKNSGYLTSNRKGTKGEDDIWRFSKRACALRVEGLVRNCETQQGVAGALVEITGSISGTHQVRTDKSGRYTYALQEDEAYVVNVLTDSLTSASNTSDFFNLAEKSKGKLSTLGECGRSFTLDFCVSPVNVTEISFPAVLYDLGQWTLRPESKDSLNYLYQILMENPTMIIEIGSHTDSRASATFNDTLSQRRAQACVDYLVNEKGIARERLVAKGYGETRPLRLHNGNVLTEKYINSLPAKERDAMNQLNRRTAFRVLSWNYVDPKNPTLKRNKPVNVRENFFDRSGSEDDENADQEENRLEEQKKIDRPKDAPKVENRKPESVRPKF